VRLSVDVSLYDEALYHNLFSSSSMVKKSVKEFLNDNYVIYVTKHTIIIILNKKRT